MYVLYIYVYMSCIDIQYRKNNSTEKTDRNAQQAHFRRWTVFVTNESVM